MSEDLARKLKQARTRLNLSQSQAAKAWDIPLRTLQKWEQEQRTPRGFAFRALETKLDAILTAIKIRSVFHAGTRESMNIAMSSLSSNPNSTQPKTHSNEMVR